jgi:hypothetical protein
MKSLLLTEDYDEALSLFGARNDKCPLRTREYAALDLPKANPFSKVSKVYNEI